MGSVYDMWYLRDLLDKRGVRGVRHVWAVWDMRGVPPAPSAPPASPAALGLSCLLRLLPPLVSRVPCVPCVLCVPCAPCTPTHFVVGGAVMLCALAVDALQMRSSRSCVLLRWTCNTTIEAPSYGSTTPVGPNFGVNYGPGSCRFGVNSSAVGDRLHGGVLPPGVQNEVGGTRHMTLPKPGSGATRTAGCSQR